MERKYSISDDEILVSEELNFGLVEVVYDWAMQEVRYSKFFVHFFLVLCLTSILFLAFWKNYGKN